MEIRKNIHYSTRNPSILSINMKKFTTDIQRASVSPNHLGGTLYNSRSGLVRPLVLELCNSLSNNMFRYIGAEIISGNRNTYTLLKPLFYGAHVYLSDSIQYPTITLSSQLIRCLYHISSSLKDFRHRGLHFSGADCSRRESAVTTLLSCVALDVTDSTYAKQ